MDIQIQVWVKNADLVSCECGCIFNCFIIKFAAVPELLGAIQSLISSLFNGFNKHVF